MGLKHRERFQCKPELWDGLTPNPAILEGFGLAVNQHRDLELGVKVLAVGAMAVGPTAGAFAFDKRAGQHFAERTKTRNRFASPPEWAVIP